jgi:hypothetical protein
MAPDTGELAARILNDWYMVRYYPRGVRREQAIIKLGLTIREAFSASNDFKALIAAVLDGGRPREEQQPF